MSKSITEFYDLILDSITQGFIIQDERGKIIRYNRSAFEILGLKPEEFIHVRKERPTWHCIYENGEICPPHDYPFLKVFRTGMPIKNIVMGIVQDTEICWVKVNSVSFNHQIPDYPEAVLTTYSDVSDQINEKKALIKREAELLETQSVARIGCWNVDLTSGVTTWTPEMFKLFGVKDGVVPPQEIIIGKMHPDDRAPWLNELEQSLIKKRNHFAKFRLILEDRIAWLECHGRYLFSATGEPIEMNGTCQDVTEATQLEIQNSFIIDSLKIGIWKWDIPQNRLIWDKRVHEIYDIPELDFRGDVSDWKKNLHPEDLERAMTELTQSLTEHKDFDTTFRVIDTKGDVRYVGAKGFVLKNQKDEPTAMYGINWDRTTEVILEQEIETERSKSIQISKLSALGEMAGGVAHEINNPLTIINSSVIHLRKQIQKKTLNEEKLLDSLQDIDVTVKRISQIVTGLRNLSRDSSSEKVTSFRLRDVFDDVLSICNEKFKLHDVEFKLEDPQHLYDELIDGRQVQLSQVILNLFTNAYDAITPLKEKWICLKLLKGESHIQILIEDSGEGIPENVKRKIFNPFFTTKDVGKGTGLGLSLSKTLIENNGGKLYICEGVHHTCFAIDLPFLAKRA